MSIVEDLARWARAVRPEVIPADVLDIARLQHIAGAGATRQVAATATGRSFVTGLPAGGAALASGGTASAEEAAAAHAGLLALYEFDDFLLAGRTGLGALPTTWALAGGHTLADLLAATVVGNEVGGRVGLACLLGPRADRATTAPAGVAAAVAAAWLEGRDEAGMASAIALALKSPVEFPARELGADQGAADLGAVPVRNAWRARSGRAGREELDALEPGSGWWDRAWSPLPGAFAGLGSTWLTRTLVLKKHPLAVWATQAVQAVDEILRRHVRAAEKRLRADQIERVDIRVPLPAWAMEVASDPNTVFGGAAVSWNIRKAVGVLISTHELTPGWLEPGALGAREADARAVADRVVVSHDWKLTLGAAEGMGGALSPVLCSVGARQAVGMARRMRGSGHLPPVRAADLAPALGARPDRVLRALRRSCGDLAGVDTATFRWHLPVEVKLYTTRGGWWPERRSLPLGSLATGDQEQVALDKHAVTPGGADAAALRTAPADTAAAPWVAELLA
jgi:2-methylcitrate dehydratase PrpD